MTPPRAAFRRRQSLDGSRRVPPPLHAACARQCGPL